MSKDKMIQISERLFMEIYKYFMSDIPADEAYIRQGLNERIEARIRHDLYSKYKNLTGEERDKARQEYLEYTYSNINLNK